MHGKPAPGSSVTAFEQASMLRHAHAAQALVKAEVAS
jgi:hypothetical protein